MSLANPRRFLRSVILPALVGLALAAPLPAQAPKGNDLIDQIKRQQEVVAQKMEAEVRDALAEAQRLSGSDPARSVERLQKVLAMLEKDQALTPGRRDLLTRQLKDRIRIAEAEAAKLAPKKTGSDQKGKIDDGKKIDAEQKAADQAYINRTLSQIEGLQKAGQTAAATKLAEDLFRRYPNLAAPQAVGRTNSILDQVTALQAMRADAERRRLGGLAQVDRSALSPGSDVEFPKDWSTRMAKRTPLNGPPLTAKEKAILQSLNSIISVDYKGTGFLDVIQDLSDRLKLPIVLDKQALADLQVSSETQVTLQLKSIGARTALRKILGDLGLSYIVKNEAIQVVTAQQARDTMVTRTYYMGDLLAGGPFTNAGIRFAPGITQFEALQNVISIVNMIQASVDPATWQANGGGGSITFHAPTMSLIVRNSAEVHGMMGTWLR